MPTDDERREVARRLREGSTLIPHKTGRHHGMGCHEAADRFWNMCDRIKAAGNYDIAFSTTSVLADFIEPSGYECVPGECPLNVRHDNDRIDRERLLAIATVMAADSVRSVKQGSSVSPVYILHAARNIAEACGETFGSIRNRELAKLGTSFVPKETIVDRDALLELADEMEQAGKEYRYQANENAVYSDLIDDAPEEFIEHARRIRKALGVCDG